jgi:hypothetical protein
LNHAVVAVSHSTWRNTDRLNLVFGSRMELPGRRPAAAVGLRGDGRRRRNFGLMALAFYSSRHGFDDLNDGERRNEK